MHDVAQTGNCSLFRFMAGVNCVDMLSELAAHNNRLSSSVYKMCKLNMLEYCHVSKTKEEIITYVTENKCSDIPERHVNVLVNCIKNRRFTIMTTLIWLHIDKNDYVTRSDQVNESQCVSAFFECLFVGDEIMIKYLTNEIGKFILDSSMDYCYVLGYDLFDYPYWKRRWIYSTIILKSAVTFQSLYQFSLWDDEVRRFEREIKAEMKALNITLLHGGGGFSIKYQDGSVSQTVRYIPCTISFYDTFIKK